MEAPDKDSLQRNNLLTYGHQQNVQKQRDKKKRN